MIRLLSLALLVSSLACIQEQSQNDEKLVDKPSYLLEKKTEQPSSTNTTKDLAADPSEQSGYSMQIRGHIIKVHVKKAGTQVLELPPAITTSLMLKDFRRVVITASEEKLRDECLSMNYKEQKHHLLISVRGAVYLNPFTSFDIKNALAYQLSVPFVAGKLPGAFDASTAHSEIFAPYLTKQEVASLESWFNSYLKSDKKAFDFEMLDDLDFETPPEVPIMEFSRLICGILMQEAHVDFVLGTEDKRVLRVKVDQVSFDR